MTIPPELLKVVAFLREQNITLPVGGQDSRQDSATGENHVLSVLQNSEGLDLKIHSANIGAKTNRNWYDLKVGKHFCNLKITALKTADNSNAKPAIFYLLTGEEPGSYSTESAFFKDMASKENPDESRDYYYLVINKTDTKDVFACSLKGLARVTANPRNLPFQCKWDECREPVERSWHEARDFLIGSWAESIKRQMRNTEAGMPRYYATFFDKKGEEEEPNDII